MKILITGAGHGMGRDIVFALAHRGHQVIATTRTEMQAQELEKEAKQENIALTVFVLDILKEEDQEKAAAHEPDILINNAAISESGPLAEIPLERVRNNFEVNVFATLGLTQRIAKNLITKNIPGRILFISSVAGKMTLPYLGSYSMTKSAMESMADALRQEVSHYGIHISVIEPGPIGTGFNEQMNASKYAWFSESSLFAKDKKSIQGFEKMLVNNQYGTQSIVQAAIHAVESPSPKTRYIRPIKYIPLVFLANLVPDRLRDWAIKKMATHFYSP